MLFLCRIRSAPSWSRRHPPSDCAHARLGGGLLRRAVSGTAPAPLLSHLASLGALPTVQRRCVLMSAHNERPVSGNDSRAQSIVRAWSDYDLAGDRVVIALREGPTSVRCSKCEAGPGEKCASYFDARDPGEDYHRLRMHRYRGAVTDERDKRRAARERLVGVLLGRPNE